MRKLALIIIGLSFLLTGCWDYQEIDLMSPVLAMGIDRIPGSQKILLTVQIANPEGKKSNKQSEGQRGTYTIMNSVGNTLGEAVRNLNSQSTRHILLSHCRVDVIGKDFAEMGIGEILDYLKRDKDSRRTDWILTTDSTAKEILEKNIEQEQVPARGLDLFLQNLSKTGPVSPINRNDFFVLLNEDSHVSYTPLVQLDDIKKQISSQLENANDRSLNFVEDSKILRVNKTAVYKNQQMIGVLNEDDTKSQKWLVDTPKGSSLTLTSVSQAKSKGKTGEILLDIVNGKTTITPQISEDGITMIIEMKVNVSLHEAETTSVNLLDPKAVAQLELQAADTMKLKIEHTIKTAQKELNSDYIGFAENLHNSYPNEWKRVKDNWDNIFPTINYQVFCKVKLLNTGVTTNPTRENEPEE